MFFEKNPFRVVFAPGETVELALRELHGTPPSSYALPDTRCRRALCGTDTPLSVTATLPAPGREGAPTAAEPDAAPLLCLTEQADGEDAAGYTFCFSVPQSPAAPSAALLRLLRGRAQFAAWLFCRAAGRTACTVTLCLYRGEEVVRTAEPLTFAKLDAFARRVLSAATQAALREAERALHRMPTLARLPFPFPAPRSGQEALMRSCFATLCRGGMLLEEAPTGTGKTVSVLFPALRALGQGKCDKVFYLTPKGTGAAAALSALHRMADRGAQVRGFALHAKETLCHLTGQAGDCRLCHLTRTGKALYRTARELFAADPFPTRDALLHAAQAGRQCPYELALCCAEEADVVMGDYNYLYSPTSVLQRFFSPAPNRPRCAVLVDEAHNLPTRARELYSLTLTRTGLAALLAPFLSRQELAEEARALEAAFSTDVQALLQDVLRQDSDGHEMGFALSAAPPATFCTALLTLRGAVEDFCRKNVWRSDEPMQALRHSAAELRRAAFAAERYDSHYRTYAKREAGEDTLSLYCADPSALLRQCTDACHAAVYFSATLTPLSFYLDQLGADRTTRTEDVQSPFERERLRIAVMDKISTRYTQREETLDRILRVVLETARGKRGNYMVFLPSFAYLDALSARFRQVAPRVPCLIQKRHMSAAEREAFLARFRENRNAPLIGFCVLGGLYAEGIDLAGDSLLGAVVVGIGLPGLSAECETVRAYYDEQNECGREYAYLYPGMNRVLQAAGRVIRTERDRGVLVLIDERFRDPFYRKVLPPHWHDLRFVPDCPSLRQYLAAFWQQESPAEP